MPQPRTLVATLLLAAAGSAAAQTIDRPVPVSPGHASRLLQVDDRCPTFSWGQVPGAEGYEVVVYRVGRDDQAPPVLRATIDGRAGSWTPTLGRCLERGARYAWSVRARRGETLSGWSAPALFGLPPRPSAAELDEALAVVREWAAGAASDGESAVAPDPDGAQLGDANSDGAKPGDRSTGDPDTTALSVDGRIEAASFSGDGSGLVNVAAAGLSCAGCVAVGELADGAVTAAKIGATCAPGQVLMRSAAGWECATLAAPACTPGDQLGCYTGPDGTLGVGECAPGARVCAADSTWGACSGEILPATAEACDGLDNTCDGTVDEGDPAALCPPTANVAATLCDAAGCIVAACEALWADADGDFANGCEAPAPGACLDGGAPRPIAGPGEGELVIQEMMADPASPLTDAAAEWFEVAAAASFDLNGLGIGPTFGTIVDEIGAADCLPVQAGDLLLFARSADPAANGSLAADHTFGFPLVNGGGDLHLAHGGTLVDAVSWSAADVEPGRARNLPPGLADAASNDDPASWCIVPADPGLLYAEGNHGTPGLGNGGCS